MWTDGQTGYPPPPSRCPTCFRMRSRCRRRRRRRRRACVSVSDGKTQKRSRPCLLRAHCSNDDGRARLIPHTSGPTMHVHPLHPLHPPRSARRPSPWLHTRATAPTPAWVFDTSTSDACCSRRSLGLGLPVSSFSGLESPYVCSFPPTHAAHHPPSSSSSDGPSAAACPRYRACQARPRCPSSSTAPVSRVSSAVSVVEDPNPIPVLLPFIKTKPSPSSTPPTWSVATSNPFLPYTLHATGPTNPPQPPHPSVTPRSFLRLLCVCAQV